VTSREVQEGGGEGLGYQAMLGIDRLECLDARGFGSGAAL
jgi:hypothetical protein